MQFHSGYPRSGYPRLLYQFRNVKLESENETNCIRYNKGNQLPLKPKLLNQHPEGKKHERDFAVVKHPLLFL